MQAQSSRVDLDVVPISFSFLEVMWTVRRMSVNISRMFEMFRSTYFSRYYLPSLLEPAQFHLSRYYISWTLFWSCSSHSQNSEPYFQQYACRRSNQVQPWTASRNGENFLNLTTDANLWNFRRIWVNVVNTKPQSQTSFLERTTDPWRCYDRWDLDCEIIWRYNTVVRRRMRKHWYRHQFF